MTKTNATDPLGGAVNAVASGEASSLSGACDRLSRAVADLEHAMSSGVVADRERDAELTERLDAAIGRLRAMLGE